MSTFIDVCLVLLAIVAIAFLVFTCGAIPVLLLAKTVAQLLAF